MSSLAKLKGADDEYKTISITHDYTKEDREKVHAKVAEAKSLEEADPSKKFVYRVRGLPGNLRIVTIQRQP